MREQQSVGGHGARRAPSIFGWLLAATALGACGTPADDLGPPVAARDLCGQVARIVCDASERCCDTDTSHDCLAAQTDVCGETLGVLVSDPRLAYVPGRGGRLLQHLETRAAACWDEPFRISEIAALFAGTGVSGADCTPPASDMLSPHALEVAAFSCADGTACRIRLAANGDPQGFCEPREMAGTDRCSHPYDCEDGAWCNLPAGARPGDWGHCQPLRADGWECASGLECASGHCGRSGCAPTPAREACLDTNYPDLVLSRDPIAYYRLGEPSGRNAADASPSASDGTYVEPVAHQAMGALAGGDDDGALSLSGMSGHVAITALDGLDADGGLTIELWVARPAEGGGGPLVELVSEDGAALRVALDAGSIVSSFLGSGDEAAVELRTAADAIGDGFHHVALTYDGTASRIFVDGVAAGSLEGAREVPVMPDVVLGFHDDMDEMRVSSLTGTLDEVALYGRALAADELALDVRAAREGPIARDFVLFAWSR